MNRLLNIIRMVSLAIASPAMTAPVWVAMPSGYQDIIKGNRLAPGANAAFRRAAAKARRSNRG